MTRPKKNTKSVTHRRLAELKVRAAAELVISAMRSDAEQGSHELNNAYSDRFAVEHPALTKALVGLEGALWDY